MEFVRVMIVSWWLCVIDGIVFVIHLDGVGIMFVVFMVAVVH